METATNAVTKPRRKRIDTAIIDASFKALIAQGYSARKAAVALGLNEGTGRSIAARIKAQGTETSALVSEARNVQLGQVYDHFLKKGLKINKVRASDVVAVAKDYRAVAYPTHQESSAPSFSFVQINLHEAAPDAALDITPHTTRGIEDPREQIALETLNDSEGI
jgi:hypothetical protein